MENSNINLDQLWKSNDIVNDDTQELLKQVKKQISLKKRMNWIVGLIAVFTISWIVGISCFYEFKMMTTWIGLGLGILAILIFAYKYFKDSRKVSLDVCTANTLEYISIFKKDKLQQIQMTGLWIPLYIILLSLGILLYSIEFVGYFPLWGQLSYYIAFAGWVSINCMWNYRIGQKKIKKFEDMIERLEHIR